MSITITPKKTLLTLLIGLIGLQILIGAQTAFAKEKNTDELKNLTFPVTEILKLPDDLQGQKYFSAQAPVVAFILDIINTLTKIAGTIAVLMLIITGFVMMFSMGNQNSLEKAKQMFAYEIIGTIAVFLSYVLVILVQSIFTS